MSRFSNLTTDGLEDTEDRLGGGSYTRETDSYTGKIKMVYFGKSAEGAESATVIFDDGKEYSETIWFTTKPDANGQTRNWFHPKDGNGNVNTEKKVPLPGFTTINDLCLLTTGYPLSDQEVEEKVVNIYDYDAKKELPKKVETLPDLQGKEVTLGIQKVTDNKQEKGDDGQYHKVADTRDFNQIVKVFKSDTKKTVVEIREGAETAAFHDAWVEKNKGKTYDKSEKIEARTGRPSRSNNNEPPKAGDSGKSAGRKSLFD